MPLCTHYPPISPLFLCLPPRLHGRFLGSKIDIFARSTRNGVKDVVFSGRFECRAGSDAPVDRFVKRRKIVEHIILLQAKVDLSDVDEKDMLDFMYTSQYHMRGIIALSLGRVADSNIENITHAVYVRFQSREDLARFSANPHFLEVLKEHVFPYCYGSLSVAFESEVEDDMSSIFRRGEDFNYGVECVLLISMFEAPLGHAIDDAMLALQNLMDEFHSLILQGTIGSNFRNEDSEYTHAAIIRFCNLEAFDMFRCSSKYKDRTASLERFSARKILPHLIINIQIWKSKFQPITRKSLLIYFNIDPVGTELL